MMRWEIMFLIRYITAGILRDKTMYTGDTVTPTAAENY